MLWPSDCWAIPLRKPTSWRATAVLVVAVAITGCVRRPPPVASAVHYTVGSGYQTGGNWYYPREDFHYDATGLASVDAPGRRLTADGELADSSAMTASHQTLQLPAVVRVTNLENGLQVVVRVNDRGPANPARVIGLSSRAASLLGVSAGVARVRVQVEERLSLALREQLRGGPVLTVAAAPRGAVQSETLAPPPGVAQSARGRSAAGTRLVTESPVSPVVKVPERLPEVAERGLAAPGSLIMVAGSFSQASYARQMAARLGDGRAERLREGRSDRYRVVAGPFTSVEAADTALDRALRAGVTDARIVVE